MPFGKMRRLRFFQKISDFTDDDAIWITHYDAEHDSFRPYLFVTWMVCSFITALCCVLVIHECVRDLASKKRNRAVPLQFINVAVGYAMFGTACAFGPIPAPHPVDVWGSIGTFWTCTLQGYFINVGAFAGSMLNAATVCLYTAIVRFNWKDERLCRVFFPWVNGTIWFIAVSLAAVPIFFESYNYSGSCCSRYAFPDNCGDREDQIGCLRGGNTRFMQIYGIAEMCVYGMCLLLSIANFCIMYCAVRQLEDNVSRYAGTSHHGSINIQNGRSKVDSSSDEEFVSSGGSEGGALSVASRGARRYTTMVSIASDDTVETMATVNRKKSNAVANQGMLWCVLFIFVFALFVMSHFGNEHFKWAVLCVIYLQGLLIAIVFARPRTKMLTWEGRLFRSVIFCTICRPIPSSDEKEDLPAVDRLPTETRARALFSTSRKSTTLNKESGVHSGPGPAYIMIPLASGADERNSGAFLDEKEYHNNQRSNYVAIKSRCEDSARRSHRRPSIGL